MNTALENKLQASDNRLLVMENKIATDEKSLGYLSEKGLSGISTLTDWSGQVEKKVIVMENWQQEARVRIGFFRKS